MPRSNADIYQLINEVYQLTNDVRKELKGDIQRVESTVNAVAQDVNAMKVSDATLKTKIYAIGAVISTVMTAFVYAVATKLVGK